MSTATPIRTSRTTIRTGLVARLDELLERSAGGEIELAPGKHHLLVLTDESLTTLSR